MSFEEHFVDQVGRNTTFDAELSSVVLGLERV